MKQYAWNKFQSGKYAAIGWLGDYDLTGMPLDEVIELIRTEAYDNEASAIDAFTKFLTLGEGDYVAVNNTNAGLFGVGIITSGYQYQRHMHDTGGENEFYSHYRNVEWKYTDYVRRRDIISRGETGWKPFGTVGNLEDRVPPYIQRLLGVIPPKEPTRPPIVPEYLKDVINSIKRLRSDPKHKERGHESLVEGFFVALGYEKHRDIRYRQGRIDVSLWSEENMLVVVEVKRDWNLSLYNSPEAVQQAYRYALDQGARYIVLANGDYYAVFDRLKGLSSSSNLIGEFRLTALEEEDADLVQRMSRVNLVNPNLEELFKYLSECFE